MTCRQGVSYWNGLAMRACEMFNQAGFPLTLPVKGGQREAKPLARAFLISTFAQDHARQFSGLGPDVIAALATLEQSFQQAMNQGDELAIESQPEKNEFTVFHYDAAHDALVAARTLKVGDNFRLEN